MKLDVVLAVKVGCMHAFLSVMCNLIKILYTFSKAFHVLEEMLPYNHPILNDMIAPYVQCSHVTPRACILTSILACHPADSLF